MEELNDNLNNTTDGKGWFANVLSSLTSAFGKFINIFKKHGFFYSILLMVIFIVFWCFIIYPININNIIEKQLEQHQQKQQKEVKELIERRYNADEIVGDIMAKLLDKFNVKRVLLLEKHNSIQSLGKVDFLYLSCSLEMVNPNYTDSIGIKYISEDLQRQVVLNLLGNDMLGLLKHRDYIYYNNVKNCNHPQHRLIHKLRDADDKEALIIPFKDNNNRPLLILVISGENINQKEIIEYINEFKKQIQEALIIE